MSIEHEDPKPISFENIEIESSKELREEFISTERDPNKSEDEKTDAYVSFTDSLREEAENNFSNDRFKLGTKDLWYSLQLINAFTELELLEIALENVDETLPYAEGLGQGTVFEKLRDEILQKMNPKKD